MHVLEEIRPGDGIPEELHFEHMPEEDELATAALSSTEFVDGLSWGRHECEVAQMLLHTWLQDHRGQEDEGLDDFFCILLAEHNAAAAEAVPATELPLSFLASFLTAPGGRALAFAPLDVDVENLRREIIQKISEEASSVHVYTKQWRATGSVAALPQRQVLQETRDRLATTVYPLASH